MLLRAARSLTAVLLLAKVAAAQGPPLELEWCTGFMPASWGFAITPSEECRRVHVRVRSSAVLLTSAKPGPGMPEGWTVETLESREAIASGPTPLAAGIRLETFLLVETNRATGSLDSRGALPVEWGIWFADEAGVPSASGKMDAQFAPVLPLAEAAGRGMVLVTHEGLGPAGPVELTVDNPTWFPLWLDVPTGTILKAEGREWVVASCAPFRMMRKQKTGRTITAFPLLPNASTSTPRRLSWGNPSVPAHVEVARALAVAADRLQDAARSSARPAAGAFERANPFEFWPVALRWATWSATGAPPREQLVTHLGDFIAARVAAGDPACVGLDAEASALEIEAAATAIAAEAASLRENPLPLEYLAARERFR